MSRVRARAVDVVRTLLDGYRFAGVGSVAELLDIDDSVRWRIGRLAAAGERLLDLDAEDFEAVAAAGGLPEPVVRQVRAAQFPTEPPRASYAGVERGSLGSLVPLYELMLEALEIRWLRREPVHVVVLLHLLAEYFPLLAWESTLGHAGDPAELEAFVGVPGSRWGKTDRTCDHNATQRAAARRMWGAVQGDVAGWTAYLDRFHSRVSDALGKCATHAVEGRPGVDGLCRTPCSVWLQLDAKVRDDLGARVHLARMYADSPAVALRHYAPVGHFFGVPAPSEISEAWQHSWERLSRPWEDGANPLHASDSEPAIGEPIGDEATIGESTDGEAIIGESTDGEAIIGESTDGEALPGLTALVAAVAGRPVGSGRMLASIRDAIIAELPP